VCGCRGSDIHVIDHVIDTCGWIDDIKSFTAVLVGSLSLSLSYPVAPGWCIGAKPTVCQVQTKNDDDSFISRFVSLSFLSSFVHSSTLFLDTDGKQRR